jgi:putative flippase GtrA
VYALATGLTGGILGYATLASLDAKIAGVSPVWLVIVIPVLWLLGVQLGYFLGRWLGFFDSFGKYAAIGFTNFAVYSAILQFEGNLTGIVDGWQVVILTSIAFALATVHGYVWNKYWSFSASASGSGQREFMMYLVVSLVSLLVHDAVAYGAINLIARPESITPEQWRSIGGIIGSAAALIFSFVGFKIFVFKQRPPTPSYN